MMDLQQVLWQWLNDDADVVATGVKVTADPSAPGQLVAIVRLLSGAPRPTDQETAGPVGVFRVGFTVYAPRQAGGNPVGARVWNAAAAIAAAAAKLNGTPRTIGGVVLRRAVVESVAGPYTDDGGTRTDMVLTVRVIG